MVQKVALLICLIIGIQARPQNVCVTQEMCLQDVVATNHTFLQFVVDRWMEGIELDAATTADIARAVDDLRGEIASGPRRCREVGRDIRTERCAPAVLSRCELRGGSRPPPAPPAVDDFFAGPENLRASAEFCGIYVTYLNAYCEYLSGRIQDLKACDLGGLFDGIYRKRWLDCVDGML